MNGDTQTERLTFGWYVGICIVVGLGACFLAESIFHPPDGLTGAMGLAIGFLVSHMIYSAVELRTFGLPRGLSYLLMIIVLGLGSSIVITPLALIYLAVSEGKVFSGTLEFLAIFIGSAAAVAAALTAAISLLTWTSDEPDCRSASNTAASMSCPVAIPQVTIL